MAKRVIVDENVGRNSALWHEFQRVLGDQPWDYVFLGEAHPGIPDVEILDKLLQPSTVLLTGDCVLHERAIQQGIRSYTLDQQGQLTRQRQPGVTVSGPLPQSVHTDLLDDYRHKAGHDHAFRHVRVVRNEPVRQSAGIPACGNQCLHDGGIFNCRRGDGRRIDEARTGDHR